VRRKLPRKLGAARLARDMSAQKKLSKFDPRPFLLEEGPVAVAATDSFRL
jgi:hypothetical protein